VTISGGDRDHIESRTRQAENANVRRPGTTLTSMGHFTDVGNGAPLATIRSLFVILLSVKKNRLPPFEPKLRFGNWSFLSRGDARDGKCSRISSKQG
jgi:hypothetical protein